MIIGLVGFVASGKGTIVKYLVDRYHGVSLKFSDILRDILDRLYEDQSRENMSHLGTWIRQEFGNDTLIRTILKDLEKKTGDLFILDGIRSHAEADVLLNRQDARLWAIDCDMRMRYERIIKRGENPGEQELTFDRFVAQHDLPSEKEIAGIMDRAHVHIHNGGDLAALYAQIDQHMTGIAHDVPR